MENLINEIKKLSKHDFPEDDVYDLLEGSRLSQKDIQDYILFNPDKYTRHLIHREESFELLVMCWRPGQKAPVHGHEGEKCFMRVEKGTLQFTNYTLESTTPLRLTISDTVKGDPGFLDGPADLHSVENIFQNKVVSTNPGNQLESQNFCFFLFLFFVVLSAAK